MNSELCTSVFEKALPFWSSLCKEDRDRLCEASRSLTYKKGTHIHDPDECLGVILVKNGCLRIYIMSDEGKSVTLYRLYSGDMCMLSASCVLKAITFEVFIDAEEDCECYVINGVAFSELSERVQDVKIFALETALSRFSDVMWIMQQILFMSLDKRLAIFLLDEHARTGKELIELTHEQIAKYMGSAREAVSRMLKYFSSEGLVEVSRKGVRLTDKKRLRDLTL